MDNKTKIKNIRLKITARFEDNKIENETSQYLFL